MNSLGSMRRQYRAREEMESVQATQSTMKGIVMNFRSIQTNIGGNAQVLLVAFYVITEIGIVLPISDFVTSVKT